MGCGLFHDVGKLNFLHLYGKTGRQWLTGEYEMAQIHTQLGARRLLKRASTCRYGEVALGHHRWYDGTHGYPESFKRLESACRQMVDVIALIDWMENVTAADQLYTGVEKSFDEALKEAVAQEGRQFSPLLTAWLREPNVAKSIRQALLDGRLEACRALYEEEGGAPSLHAF